MKLGSHKQDVEELCYSIAFASTATTHIEPPDNIKTAHLKTELQSR